MANSTASPHAPFKSVPYYPPMAINPDAQCHLLISDGSDLPRTQALVSRLAQTRQVDCLVLGAADSPSLQSLQQVLEQRFARLHVGVQLHVLGSEAFIWAIHAQAITHGFSNDEISLCAPTETVQRPVYCVHCSSVHSHPLADAVKCPACAVALEVRGHFSRRLGAYLGVCLNADAPYSELPA
ncbi:dimethylamine monooxygenase subunit DmmA family protein [Pseudomonas defluvii]|uniref:dimethylamine monooxygenase subunit DmmA family protein n=1 Tax=Pseudomonas defluvii TaxID=1876757 RepID=UPI0009F6A791|nr:dimethylamine monooxygenase subunit DmmA family protein [Pseudomonas defluvii]